MSIMDKIAHDLQKKPEKKNKKSTQIDLKNPFDMKMFWKKINEYHFSTNSKINFYEINHLVNLFSQHGKLKNLTFLYFNL